jgi:hypothetical protein
LNGTFPTRFSGCACAACVIAPPPRLREIGPRAAPAQRSPTDEIDDDRSRCHNAKAMRDYVGTSPITRARREDVNRSRCSTHSTNPDLATSPHRALQRAETAGSTGRTSSSSPCSPARTTVCSGTSRYSPRASMTAPNRRRAATSWRCADRRALGCVEAGVGSWPTRSPLVTVEHSTSQAGATETGAGYRGSGRWRAGSPPGYRRGKRS